AWTGRVCRRPMSLACALDGAWLKRGEDGLAVEPMAPKFASLRSARRMDRLVVASRFMEEELVTNGCDPGRVVRLAPVPRRDSSTPPPAEGDDSTDLLFVGQLVRGKGVDLLLRALPLMDRRPRVTFVGDGNARESLEKLADRLGLSGRTRFLGWVDPARIGAFYAGARVVVMPGRWPEPFGLVGLEAMAHGKPVVAFDVGGVRDWLADGDTGLLVPEQDLGQMAGALDRLLSDETLRRRLGRRAQRTHHERFRFQPYLHRLVSLLRSLDQRGLAA
ncbi:MAG: glycosyltransferase, partial [Acidobacteriota bacterium]